MKTRHDFVSNSSSCSFVIENPGDLSFDSNLVRLIMNANYLHFVDVNYGNFRKTKYGNTVKAFDKFEDDIRTAFGTKANVGFEHRDCDEVPPEEVYVELDTDNFYRNYSAKKRDLLEKLIANSSHIYVDFGEDCDGGVERATQAATLLDYIYKAEISAEDNFEYSPVDDLGVQRHEDFVMKMCKKAKIDPNNMDAEIEIDSSTVCAHIVSNDEFLHSTDKDIEDLKDRMFGKKRKDSIYYGDIVKLPLRVLLKLYRNVEEVAEAAGKRIA